MAAAPGPSTEEADDGSGVDAAAVAAEVRRRLANFACLHRRFGYPVPADHEVVACVRRDLASPPPPPKAAPAWGDTRCPLAKRPRGRTAGGGGKRAKAPRWHPPAAARVQGDGDDADGFGLAPLVALAVPRDGGSPPCHA